MDLGLEGRRAAVAAASSGLGLASAVALAAEGADVVICGRDATRLDDAARVIGRGCVPIVADVSTIEGARAFVEQAAEALGGIDILIPNGGGPPPGTFASTPVDAYQPAMQERGWGRVVAITSLSVRQPIGTLILSNTARAGVTGFLKTLALEVAGQGVTVNSVQPGLHRTPRVEDLYPADQIGALRMGEAADFGAVVAFLCSEQAKFTTGVQLHVDGGAYAGLL
jgi:3-oxoacyl-[acyl-carrier protein] reductase